MESLLPKCFKALEEAAKRKETLLDEPLYENLCRYCTMLKLSSLAGKAGAVVELVIQANWELENGQRCLLKYLGVPESLILQWTREYADGRRVVLDCDNPAQMAFRIKYDRTCDVTFAEFLRSNWKIATSPINLPLSDVGLIPIVLERPKAHHYLLPIGPRLLLSGVHFFDHSKNSREPLVRSFELPTGEAEYFVETICLSAIEHVIATEKDPKVPEIIARRDLNQNQVFFQRVTNPAQIASSGRIDSDGSLRLKIVPVEEYVKFVHSFMTPAPATN